MVITINGVLRDGSAPAANLTPIRPYLQRIELPRGEDLLMKLVVLREGRTAADLTGGTTTFGVRKFRHDEQHAFEVEVTGGGPAGLADIVVPSASTIALIENFDYVWDIQRVDAAGKRWQLVPASPLRIIPIVNRPGD